MSEATESSGGLGIGVRLRAARERAGLSLIQAGKKLHLDPKVLEALENEQFEFLGAPVYVRGHMRRYAELVGEDPTELQATYSGSLRVAPAPDLTHAPHAALGLDPRRIAGPLLVAAGGLALTATVWWVASGFPLPASMRAPPPVAAQSSPPPPAPVPATTAPASPVEAPLRTPAPDPVAQPTPRANVPPARPTEVQPAPQTAAQPVRQADAPPSSAPSVAREVELRLTLNADSWVEVYDARGERLYYDVATANSVQTLSGRAPLRVTLGNAPGVAVAVNGREIALPAAAGADDQTRFVISSSGRVAKAR